MCMAFESLIFLYYKYKSTPKNKRFMMILLILLLISVISIIFIRVVESSEYLQLRMERTIEGDVSGRDKIYENAFVAWTEGDLLQLLFGYGFAQSVNIMGTFAHNDWLELLVCQGLLGVFLYLWIFACIIVFYLKNKHLLSSQYKMIFLMVMYIWIIRTIVSMGYADQIMFICSILIAMIQNLLLNRKNNYNI